MSIEPATRTVLPAFRYVQPLREGGSLPAVVDTSDGLFVVKFRGAGQGARVLVAELLAGGLAQAAGLPVPELALVSVSAAFGRSEPDSEIREMLRRSHGINVGLRYLDGAFNYDPVAAGDLVSPALAARTVWLDAFTMNPDRTARNPNLLVWRRAPWLIDHGAALYVHHDWETFAQRAGAPFDRIREHVLLPRAIEVRAVDAEMRARVAPAIESVVSALPDELLEDDAYARDGIAPHAARTGYREFLRARLAAAEAFVDAADEARRQRLHEARIPRTARR